MSSEEFKDGFPIEELLKVGRSSCSIINRNYGVPFDTCEMYLLEVIKDYKEKLDLLSSADLSYKQRRRNVLLYIKDRLRKYCGVKQIKDDEGKLKWTSPYPMYTKEFNEDIHSTVEEEPLSELSIMSQKELFYRYRDKFSLTQLESDFIDLCFGGYNVYNEFDVIVFEEALKKSRGYLRHKFFSDLEKKLKKKSKELGWQI